MPLAILRILRSAWALWDFLQRPSSVLQFQLFAGQERSIVLSKLKHVAPLITNMLPSGPETNSQLSRIWFFDNINMRLHENEDLVRHYRNVSLPKVTNLSTTNKMFLYRSHYASLKASICFYKTRNMFFSCIN